MHLQITLCKDLQNSWCIVSQGRIYQKALQLIVVTPLPPVAAAIKDLRTQVVPFLASIVRHYTMVAVAQQSGPFPVSGEKQSRNPGMDPAVLIDALAIIMGHEEKELCKPGNLALFLILDTAKRILGSSERVGHYLGYKK